MARPKHETPTAAELEVLKTLWEIGPATVRQVMDVLNPDRSRAYTSVMSLMNVMADKGLVRREPQGRAFVYEAAVPQEETLGAMLNDLVGRAFAGSASALVQNLLGQTGISPAELDEIRQVIDNFEEKAVRTRIVLR